MIEKQIADTLKYYSNEPIEFFVDWLDCEEEYMWDKMRVIAESVKDNRYTAVKAAHSVSKSYTAARLALWFLKTHYPSTVITTAPTYNQVEGVLWREIRVAYAQAKIGYGGKITKTKLEMAEKWFAYGFSTRADTVTQQATAFQGYHNKYVLIILDEAAGIAKEIWEAIDSLMSSGNCRLLAIGNPTSCKGEFPKCFKDAKYNKITISVFDTPNYKAGKDIIPGLSGREFVEMVERKYGKDSNYYKARVLGQIPDDDIDSIITVTTLENAYNKHELYHKDKRRFVTGDPADGGDESVFYLMEETQIIDEMIFSKKNTMATAGRVNIFMEQNNVTWYAGDCIGIGAGICDRLEEFGKSVERVDSRHGKPNGVPDIYYNLRAQMWIEAGERFSEDDIELHWDDEVLKEQLVAVKQTIRRGRIIIESKDIIRKELGRSPDRADAYIIGLYALNKIPIPEREPRDGWEKEAKPLGYMAS